MKTNKDKFFSSKEKISMFTYVHNWDKFHRPEGIMAFVLILFSVLPTPFFANISRFLLFPCGHMSKNYHSNFMRIRATKNLHYYYSAAITDAAPPKKKLSRLYVTAATYTNLSCVSAYSIFSWGTH